MKTNRLQIKRIALLTALLQVACSSGQHLGDMLPNAAQVIEANGFSFRPMAGFVASVEGSQATLRSQDAKIEFMLTGRSACEVKPLEKMIQLLVDVYTQSFEEFEASEPYPITVSDKEGLSIDVTGTRLTYLTRDTRVRNWITGRVVLLAPSDARYFYAFATVADSSGGNRWQTEGHKAFNALMDSIVFSELTSVSNALPCLINHEPQEVVVDRKPFTDAGCTSDEYGRWACQADSPLTDLGCVWIGGPFGGLDPSYPIASCWTGSTSNESRCGFRAFCHPDICAFCYVVFEEGQFGLIETEEDLRETFAPIDTEGEALAYALAVMAGRKVWPGAPRAYYGLELDLALEYAVDVIEDTHVEAVRDGYVVHLFLYDRWGCDHPTFYAVDIRVTPQGHVEEAGKDVVFVDPSRPCVE